MRTLLLALLLLFIPAAAQVVPGSTTELSDADGCTLPCTVGSVTVPASGDERMALVSVLGRWSNGSWTTRTATLGGESLFVIQKSPAGTSSYELVNFCLPDADFPATGSQSLVLGGSWGTNTAVSAMVTFVTDADQTCPPTNAVVSDGTAAAAANSRTPLAEGALFYHSVVIAGDRVSTLDATSPQTLIEAQVVNQRTHGVSYEIVDDTSEAEFTWTTNAGYRSGGFIIEAAGTELPPEETIDLISDAAVVECFCPGLFHIPSQTLPEGQEEEVYVGVQLQVLAGAAPRTWAVSGGALPAGLSLSSTGEITGTVDAAEAGSHNFTIEVTDADGGLAYRDLAIVVNLATGGGGALAFYEDVEDTNIGELETEGDCAATNTGVLEGEYELTKSGPSDCVLFSGVNEPQVFFGIDILNFAPATSRDQAIVGLDADDDVLFSCRLESDSDIFCKTPGQTENSNRGFHLSNLNASELASGYVELHYVAGATGSDALFRARFNGGLIETFSAGTAITNLDRIVLRDANDNGSQDFVYDRIEAKDHDWPGRGPLPVDPPPSDTTPPTVLSTVPLSGATGVGLSSDITATFSEPMDAGTITTSTFTLAQGATPVSGAVTYSGTTATFDPNSNLSGTTSYTATITTGVEDLAGNNLATSHVWSFTTGAAADTTPPTVSSTVPANSATGVPINTTLTANFSEAMDPATITTSSFTLARGATPVPGVVNYSGTSASFIPTASLSPNSSHTATITTAAEDLAGNAIASNQVWSFATAAAPSTPPWITNFTAQRTHYVTPNGSGSQNGTIGNPESFATARTHYLCGDLHIYRGGSYTIASPFNAVFSRDCTQSNPAVFKGYVDANGQEEDANWNFKIHQPARWNWFVNLHGTGFNIPNTTGVGIVEFRKAGNRWINSVGHDTGGVIWSSFRVPNGSEPGRVAYGNVLYRAGAGVNGAHNVYTTNDFDTNGYKYFVQNMIFEPQDVGRRMFQANDSNGDRGLSGYWLEKNFVGDRSPTGDSNTIVWTQGIVGQGNKEVVFKDNVFADFFHSTSLRASIRLGTGDTSNASVQFVFTGNYFARANFSPTGYWGNSGTHPPIVFTGNEIYDPPGGVHIYELRTRGLSGAIGSHKFLDADNWNNNTYGGTFQAQPFCNGTNNGTVNMTNWRLITDGCRVTPASAVGFDINSTTVANPTTDYVEVHKNEWQCSVGCPFTDQSRGNVYCVNWDGNGTCSANIASVVGFGKTYKVRYPRDFFGPVAAEGTCPASGACNVSLPTRRNSSAASGKFANAWVITAQP